MEILRLGDNLLVVEAAQVQLICNALQENAVGYVGAYVAQTNDTDFALCAHNQKILSTHGRHFYRPAGKVGL